VSFDRQPTLKGRLVELRPLRSEDYDDLYAVASDPLIWEQHPARDRHEEARFRSVEKIGGVLGARPDAEGRLVYRITASALAGSRRRA
jgi:hypothetical protein